MHTERLLLTPLQLEDAPAVQQRFPLWDIVRYLNNRVPWPYPQDGALRYIQDVALPAIANGTEWHWMIRLQSAPHEIIGSITLMTHPGNTNEASRRISISEGMRKVSTQEGEFVGGRFEVEVWEMTREEWLRLHE
ncbi:acetyltransferase [Pseudomonas syringae pv. syringae]|nr:acetyltransferase [Pseudomonas syringae pv. syringae]